MKTFKIFCGLPGSGKDYIIERDFSNENTKMLSFDDLRVKRFLKKHPEAKTLSIPELYNKAWKYCVDCNYNLLEAMGNEISSEKNENISTFILNNTNLTRKARKALINLIKSKFKDCEIKCYFVFNDIDMIIKNDSSRSSKSVGIDVINSMRARIEVPTMNEGFDFVEYIFNMENKG